MYGILYFVKDINVKDILYFEGQAWCSGESCLTESPGHGFEAGSPQILRGEGLPRVFPPQTPLMWEPSALGLP